MQRVSWVAIVDLIRDALPSFLDLLFRRQCWLDLLGQLLVLRLAR